MAITKYDFRRPAPAGWSDLDVVSNRLARFFDAGPTFRVGAARSWAPRVNVTETNEALLLTAELPGLAEEDISVELENNVLSIAGEKAETSVDGDEERRYHVFERTYGSFKRSFTLPRSVSGDDISARFENGVLTIDLPKSPEAQGRKIVVSTN